MLNRAAASRPARPLSAGARGRSAAVAGANRAAAAAAGSREAANARERALFLGSASPEAPGAPGAGSPSAAAARARRRSAAARLGSKSLAVLMAVILAVGLMPLPAFGDGGVVVNGQRVVAAAASSLTAVDADGNVTTESAEATLGSDGTVTVDGRRVPALDSTAGSLALYRLQRLTAGSATIADLKGYSSASGLSPAAGIAAAAQRAEDEAAAALGAEDAAVDGRIASDPELAEQLAGMDFSTLRVVVALEDGASLQERDLDCVASEGSGLYVLQYGDEDSARRAYVRYLDRGGVLFAAPDSAVEAADGASGSTGGLSGSGAGNGGGNGSGSGDGANGGPDGGSGSAGSGDGAGSEGPGTDAPVADLGSLEDGQQALADEAERRESGDATKAAPERRALVALIDTAVPSDFIDRWNSEGGHSAELVGRVSAIGDAQPDVRTTDEGYEPSHGARMLAAILEANPDARVLSVEALDDTGYGSAATVYAALALATAARADVYSMSFAGYAVAGNEAIEAGVREALQAAGEQEREVALLAAAGNQNQDARFFVPASYDGVDAVGALDPAKLASATADQAKANPQAYRQASSNYGDAVDLWAPGDSTSFATATAAGALSDLFNSIASGNRMPALQSVLLSGAGRGGAGPAGGRDEAGGASGQEGDAADGQGGESGTAATGPEQQDQDYPTASEGSEAGQPTEPSKSFKDTVSELASSARSAIEGSDPDQASGASGLLDLAADKVRTFGVQQGVLAAISAAPAGAKSRSYTLNSPKTLSNGVATFSRGTSTAGNYSSGSVDRIELSAGIYKLEAYGAYGSGQARGSAAQNYTKGGYSVGVITLTESHWVYVVCGATGPASAGGAGSTWSWNGGGPSDETGQKGGGATHMAIDANLGELVNYSSAANKAKVLLVAGGAAGIYQNAGSRFTATGRGGGAQGGDGTYDGTSGWGRGYGGKTDGNGKSTSGTAGSSAGSAIYYAEFGLGGSGRAGGGGGWYGGGAGWGSEGGGGSGYLNMAYLQDTGYASATSTITTQTTTQTGNSTDEGSAKITKLPSYTVKFEINSTVASGSMADAVASPYDDYKVPGNGFTSPTGYRFLGWKVKGSEQLVEGGADANPSKSWWKNDSKGTVADGSTVTLIAQWGKVVNYRDNNDNPITSYSSPDESFFLSESDALAHGGKTEKTYAPDGKVFVGWSKTRNDTAPSYKPGEGITESYVTVYPVYADGEARAASTPAPAQEGATYSAVRTGDNSGATSAGADARPHRGAREPGAWCKVGASRRARPGGRPGGRGGGPARPRAGSPARRASRGPLHADRGALPGGAPPGGGPGEPPRARAGRAAGAAGARRRPGGGA